MCNVCVLFPTTVTSVGVEQNINLYFRPCAGIIFERRAHSFRSACLFHELRPNALLQCLLKSGGGGEVLMTDIVERGMMARSQAENGHGGWVGRGMAREACWVLPLV